MVKSAFIKLISLICIIAIAITAITLNVFGQTDTKDSEEFALTDEEKDYLASLSGRPIKLAYSYDLLYDLHNGTPSGMLMPFINLLQNDFGLTIQPVKLPWQEALDSLGDEAVDIYGLVALNENRYEEYYTIDPIYKCDGAIISHISKPIGSLINLKNRKVGLLNNSVIDSTIRIYLSPNGRIVYYPSVGEMIDALENDEIDCFAIVNNSEFELLRHPQLQYEYIMENFYGNEGFVSLNDELKPLFQIVNRYLAVENNFMDEVAAARRKALIQYEHDRFRREISFLRNNYDEIITCSNGTLYPLCYLENGQYEGIQVDLNDLFTELTGVGVKIEDNTNSFDLELDRIRDGSAQALVGVYYNNDIYTDADFIYSEPIWVDAIKAYTYESNDRSLADLKLGANMFAEGYLSWDVIAGKRPAIYSSRRALMEALKNKEIDVAFVSEMTFNYYYTTYKDYSLREYENISAIANSHILYGSQNAEFNRLYNETIKLYNILNPKAMNGWRQKAGQYKSDYIRFRDSTETLIIVILISFCIMLALLFYLLRRYRAYDNQISKLIRTQQTFDLAWVNLKTRRFISKGNHPFFREWGLTFSGASCSLDEMSAEFGRDLYSDCVDETEKIAKNNLCFTITDRKVKSKIDGKTKHYRRYFHRLSSTKFMLCLQDINDDVLKEKELTKIASTDFLSNLLTRRAMNDKLIAKCKELRGTGKRAFLLMIDVDNFKIINDSYGHDVGDEVLKAVAKILQSGNERGIITSRWGGEEFLSVLDSDDIETARNRANVILTDIAKQEVEVDDKTVSFTVSIGLSELNTETDYSDSVKKADIALYQAKGEGKNCVRVCV